MSEENNRPRYYISSKRECEGKNDVWRDIAVIFPSRQGDGFDVLVKGDIADIRGGDKLFIRPPKPKPEKSREEGSNT